MKHVVSFSGGLCSFWAAHRVISKFGPADVVLLFADTLMEDEDLYRFLGDACRVLQVPVTRIADGRTPWQLFTDQHMMGNSRVDLCSRILKRDLLHSWFRTNCDITTDVLYLGIDWTEDHRLLRSRKRLPDWKIEAPMCEPPLWNKCQMIKELKTLGIEPPRLYSYGFPHNNCSGFCVKAGQAQFALLLKSFPEKYAWHEAQEEQFRAQVGKNVSILRDRRGGQVRPLSLREFRSWVEAGKYDHHEWGGCGCAVDVDDTELSPLQEQTTLPSVEETTA